MKQGNLLNYISKLSIKPSSQESQTSEPVQQLPKVEPDEVNHQNKPLNKLKRLQQESDSDEQDEKQQLRQELFNDQKNNRTFGSHPVKKLIPAMKEPQTKTTGKPASRRTKKDKMEVESQNSQPPEPIADQPVTTVGGAPMEFTDKTPWWAVRGTLECLDKNRRNHTDPEYDATSLYIPEKEFKQLTNTMKQYWAIKQNNMDKVVMFKLGKFYEFFYDDAEITNKYLNLNWMGTKMHTGFPEKCLDRYIDELVELGFKVMVVEQMETPEEMQNRVKEEKKNTGKTAEKCITREVTQVLTKGTYTKPASLNDQQNGKVQRYTPNYLLALQCVHPLYAFTLLDTANNQIIIGLCKSLEQFKTMLYQTRPVQLLYDPANLPLDEKKMMTESFLGMIQSPLTNKDSNWHHLNSMTIIKERLSDSFPEAELEKHSEKAMQLMYGCLSGLFIYLKSMLLLDTVLHTVRFQMYDPEKALVDHMVLDSQALQHLELLETSAGEEKGSLLSVVNRCRTGYGKRLMKRWLCSPSTNVDVINQRLDAVEDLNSFLTERNRLSDELGRLVDLQSMTNKLYRYSVKNLVNKAVYFSDVNAERMKQYRKFFVDVERSWNSLSPLRKQVANFKSKRLASLLSVARSSDIESIYVEDQFEQLTSTPLLPDVLSHLREIDEFVKWEGDKPMPQKGLFEAYDRTLIEIAKIQEDLKDYLEQQRSLLNDPKIQFAHTKERYELEIPERTVKRKPDYYIFTSKKQGIERYVTKEIRKLVHNLEEAEQRLKDHLRSYTSFFFEEFRKKSKIWQQYARVLAELDCLMSNAAVSQMWESCRPTFNNAGRLDISQGRHPCLSHLIFVPNEIHLNSDKSMMLLTGPNMGGKSTLLRMVCVLAVMAQMGIFVPCNHYDSIIFDRVFTRIGASDRLIEKKSTFYIEMEQTKSILDHATPKSLVIVDELGRGTSTFDGMSIAEATFKYLCERVKCLGLFATHYNILVEEFMFNNNVSIHHMSYLVNEDTRQIKFLYRLKAGKCDQSFAVNVARMVGIDPDIIAKAEDLARVMKAQIQRKRLAQVNGNYEQLLLEFGV